MRIALFNPRNRNAKTSKSQAIFKKTPYVWALPYRYRDHLFETYNIDEALAADHVLVNSDEGLRAMENAGYTLRDSVTKYENLYGCAAGLGSGRVYMAVPTLRDMRSHSRVMRFFYVRLMDRIYNPERYLVSPAFNHVHIPQGQQHQYIAKFKKLKPVYMSLDLETSRLYEIFDTKTNQHRRYGAVITMASYTLCFYENGQWIFNTYTQDFASEADWELLDFVCRTPTPKTLQNGQYDFSILLRWRIPLVNYIHDTQDWMRSVTPHLKKKIQGKQAKGFYNLQYIANMYLMHSLYWKDGLSTVGKDFQLYAARDAHNTAAICLAQLARVSKETFNNFLISAAIIYPCAVMGVRGLRYDEVERKRLTDKYVAVKIEADLKVQGTFGVRSTQTKKQLPYLQAMARAAMVLGLDGAKEIEKADKDARRDLSLLHPVYSELLSPIDEASRASKWLTTYILKQGLSARSYNGGFAHEGIDPDDQHFMFKLDPFSTDTRRLASAQSHLWIGSNAQNVPKALRTLYVPKRGEVFGASDYEAVETYCTAFNAKCETMYRAVSGAKYFHALNAVEFFGVKYEDIYDDATKTKLDKTVINMSKRVNHGANYLMGVFVFIQTVGLEMVYDMKRILKLPDDYSVFKTVKYVLDRFDVRFPEVRGAWADEQAMEIVKTGRLHCITGYKPLFLESPLDSKSTLNTAVATESQHVGTGYISLRALMKFYKAEFEPNAKHKIALSVHDETLWTCKPEDADEVSELYKACADVSISYPFKWSDGTEAVLNVPTSDPETAKNWGGV